MESGKIEKLLQKYEEGQTSLAEEKILRDYFLENEVPEDLRPYKLMFMFSEKQKHNKLEETPKMANNSYRFTWASIAAILIIALGIFFFFNNQSSQLSRNDLGTITDEEMALQKTKETLQMVSQIMNEGSADLVYLKEFNKTTNKIIDLD